MIYIPEKTYRYISKKLSNLEQKFLHCWEVELLDEIKNYKDYEKIT
jgi:hypothetical protein